MTDAKVRRLVEECKGMSDEQISPDQRLGNPLLTQGK